MTEHLCIIINGPPAAKLHRFWRSFPAKLVTLPYNSFLKSKRNGLWDFCPHITQNPSGFRLKLSIVHKINIPQNLTCNFEQRCLKYLISGPSNYVWLVCLPAP